MGPLIGYVPGVFDLFHVGHLTLLRQAREHCDVLVAGVVSDEVCISMKNVRPTVPVNERAEIVEAIGIVDAVYVETTLDKGDAWQQVGFRRIFKGDDWRDTPRGAALEHTMLKLGVEVVYFPYTVHTSSTALRRAIGVTGERVS